MIDGNTLLSSGCSARGADMGRRNIADNPEATVLLFRMRMSQDGCYDMGGAYWGSGTPMYAAIGDGFQFFRRAKTLAIAKANLLKEFPKLVIDISPVNDDFLAAYIAAALWSTNDESDEETGGDPMDSNYGPEDIHPDLLERMTDDCRLFLAECGHLITPENCLQGECFEQAGHDFWLTRNGHGCGFWDGDWADLVEKTLTEAAKKFGEYHIYVDGEEGDENRQIRGDFE